MVALLVGVAGTLLERRVFGTDDAFARREAETAVRAAFEAMAQRLREMSRPFSDRTAIRAAARGDNTAARQLFTAADAVLAADVEIGTALTVYDAKGTAVAWAGRASDLPPERLLGSAGWFVARGPLGPRLVYATPVDEAGSRIGTVAVERPIGPASGIGGAQNVLSVPTGRFDVAIELLVRAQADPADDSTFEVRTPDGGPLLVARIADEDLSRARERVRRATWSVALIIVAATFVLLLGPILDWRQVTTRARPYAVAVSLAIGLIVLARYALRVAAPADWSDANVFSAAAYASQNLRPLLTSPFDFLATALAAGGTVALLLMAVEAWRLHLWNRRRSAEAGAGAVGFVVCQLAAGIGLAAVLLVHQALVRDTIANTELDLLHFSLQPIDVARLALQVGLVIAHATALGLGVLLLRIAAVPWRTPRTDWRLRLGTWFCWALPLMAWQFADGVDLERQLPLLVTATAAAVLALAATRLKARYRHGSQAFRLVLLTLGLLVPAFVLYPATVQLATDAKEQLIESRYAPQALMQRTTLQAQLELSLTRIDDFDGLAMLLDAPTTVPPQSLTDSAFRVWQSTPLGTETVTSSVELYGRNGTLVSRFALQPARGPHHHALLDEDTCDWAVYEEVAPFFAEERRMLHAGRHLCRSLARASDRSSCTRCSTTRTCRSSPRAARTWSCCVPPIRCADRACGPRRGIRVVRLEPHADLFLPRHRVGASRRRVRRCRGVRDPFWTRLSRGQDRFDVYLQNDRGGIYALGFPVVSPLGHLVNLAEVTVLAVGTYVLLLAVTALVGILGRRGSTAPALLREVRASFYRKLFLAFVAAVFVPVVALALVTRNYVADEMRRNIEQEAVRTAAAAGRVVEDLAGPRTVQQQVDDNLTVWVSRLIDQDVNIFEDAQLLATSERNLFASGLLPTRTPAEVYQALRLRNEAATVVRERIGSNEYLLAATPLTVRERIEEGILTVPLTSRQQEIDEEIDDPRSTRAAGGAALHPGRRRPRLFDGRAHLRSGQPADARHSAHRPRRPRRAHRRHAPPTNCGGWSTTSTAWRPTCSGSAASSNGRTASRRGPRWRARWRTRSRTR